MDWAEQEASTTSSRATYWVRSQGISSANRTSCNESRALTTAWSAAEGALCGSRSHPRRSRFAVASDIEWADEWESYQCSRPTKARRLGGFARHAAGIPSHQSSASAASSRVSQQRSDVPAAATPPVAATQSAAAQGQRFSSPGSSTAKIVWADVEAPGDAQSSDSSGP